MIHFANLPDRDNVQTAAADILTMCWPPDAWSGSSPPEPMKPRCEHPPSVRSTPMFQSSTAHVPQEYR
jgi:hypothetical protein